MTTEKETVITVKSSSYRICGYVGGREVVSMMTIHGKWIVGSSSCLPANVEMARLYLECMQRVFDAAEAA